MKTIGIIVAMEKEFAQLRTLLTHAVTETHYERTFITGTIGDNRIIMQQCGIGKVNAAVGAVEMIHAYHPDLIISTGVAGGADTRLNITEVVVGTGYNHHDAYCGSEVAYGQLLGQPATYEAPAYLIEKALKAGHTTPVHAGRIVSGDWFVDTKEKMREILGHFPDAMAVDMESCSIAQVCHIYHTEFVSFRIISDIPLKDTKATQYFDFWSRLAEGSFEVTRAFLEQL